MSSGRTCCSSMSAVSSRTAAPSAARAAVFESRINQNGAEAQAGSWSQRTTRWRATRARARRDVRSAFALRGESENRSLVFSLLRLRRCRIQVPVSVAKGEYYPTCFAKHLLLAQREVGRVCYGDAPFRDGAYWPCGDAHVFFARHLLARRVNVHL